MKEKLQNKLLLIMTVICIISLVTVGVLTANLLHKSKEPIVTTADISQRLLTISELATSQLQYRGIVRYEEGEIAFINKKSYTMLYDAKVKAGVDLSKAKVELQGETITITLPAAQILDVNIDPDTLEFYDEKNSIFNWDSKSDTITALQLAKENAKEKIDETDLLKTASSQAKLLIQNLLGPAFSKGDIPYQVEVKEGS